MFIIYTTSSLYTYSPCLSRVRWFLICMFLWTHLGTLQGILTLLWRWHQDFQRPAVFLLCRNAWAGMLTHPLILCSASQPWVGHLQSLSWRRGVTKEKGIQSASLFHTSSAHQISPSNIHTSLWKITDAEKFCSAELCLTLLCSVFSKLNIKLMFLCAFLLICEIIMSSSYFMACAKT